MLFVNIIHPIGMLIHISLLAHKQYGEIMKTKLTRFCVKRNNPHSHKIVIC